MYQPTNPPNPMDPAQAWALREFMAISRYLSGSQDYVRLNALAAAPAKPFADMVVRADGTNWNPGAGPGTYEYQGGTWVKL